MQLWLYSIPFAVEFIEHARARVFMRDQYPHVHVHADNVWNRLVGCSYVRICPLNTIRVA